MALLNTQEITAGTTQCERSCATLDDATSAIDVVRQCDIITAMKSVNAIVKPWRVMG